MSPLSVIAATAFLLSCTSAVPGESPITPMQPPPPSPLSHCTGEMGDTSWTAHDKLASALGAHYKEYPVNLGIAENTVFGKNILIEVLASKNGETFSIIATRPDGCSIPFMAGENWETFEYKVRGQGL